MKYSHQVLSIHDNYENILMGRLGNCFFCDGYVIFSEENLIELECKLLLCFYVIHKAFEKELNIFNMKKIWVTFLLDLGNAFNFFRYSSQGLPAKWI